MPATFPCAGSIGRGNFLAKGGTTRGMNVRQHLGRWLAVACIAAIEPRRALPLQLQRGEDLAAPRAFIEQGKFLLHKFEQPIGEETYRIAPDGDGFTVAINFKFTDRGTDVPLSATFRGSADFSPRTFEIKGKTSRLSDIDQAVEIKAGRARIRRRNQWTDVTLPLQFFTLAGYAPTTMQMVLFRYWTAHGSPKELVTLPDGSVKISSRGSDTIFVNGKSESLDRYAIEGLIWGRETVWFDSQHNLVAVVTCDAEFDHFEAVRTGYESALGSFVSRAGADGMAALSEVSKRIVRSQPNTLVVAGGTLIDGTGRASLPDAVVIIRDGRIVATGPRSHVRIPKDAQVVDGRGKTMLPGLWDMHAHFEQVEWGPLYLAAGVTTVRDCGNEFEFITAVRDAVAHGRGLGPRALAAGIVDGSGPSALGTERVDTPEQARDWVHRYHDAGFQQMKIYNSVKLEEVKVVAEEAHRLGMTVTGHVPRGLSVYEVVEAGQDQINHIASIMETMHAPLPSDAKTVDRMRAAIGIDLNSNTAQRAIAFLKAHQVVVDPTLALYELQTASSAKPTASFEPGVDKIARELAAQLIEVGPPDPETETREKFFAKALEVVGALHRAGLTVVAGTDQAVPGHSLHREIELYYQAGFTPIEAIQAATIVPARAMGLDQELGTLEVGKRGDMILLDADPLVDIRNIRRVSQVIVGGKIYKSADLWRSVGFKP